MANKRPGSSLSTSANFGVVYDPILSVALRTAKEVSRARQEPPFIKDIADTVMRLVELATDIKRDDKQCRSLLDKTLSKSHVLLESCKRISISERKGEIYGRLTNELKDYSGLLEEIKTEIQKQNSSNLILRLTRGRKTLRKYERRLDSFENDHIFRFMPISSQLEIVSAPSPLSTEVPLKEQTDHHTKDLLIQEQGGLFQNAKNFVINSGHFNDVRGNLTIVNQSGSTPSITTYAHMLPPKPQYLFERERELEHVISTLLRVEHGKVAILGGGGMGKTTIAVSAMHDERVIARYGKQRLYVFCEGITAVNLVWLEIASILGISHKDHGAELPAVVLGILRKQATIFCLDNFETLWEPAESRPKAEELLAHLSSVDSLSLIITMRGTQLPAQASIVWSKPSLLPLNSLSRLGAEKIMNAIADVGFGDDNMDRLLTEVEGVPLAITLLAYLLQEGNETPESLWKRWQSERTRILDTGGHNRLSTLDISIQISIDSDRMQDDPNAIDLLALFSLLPSGFPESDEFFDGLEELLPPSFNLRRSILTLRRVALISSVDSLAPRRLRILPPIRHFSQANLNVDQSHKSALVNFYVDLMITKQDFYNSSLHRIIPPELGNVQCILQNSYPEISTSKLAIASISFTYWSEYLGILNTDVIQLATINCAESLGDVANCFKCLGDSYFRRNRLEEAEASLDHAVNLHQRANSIHGKAYDLLTLGALYIRRDQLEEAEAALNRAVDLHRQSRDNLGEAYGLRTLGSLFLRRNQLNEADTALNRAVHLHQQANSVLGEADDLQILGDLYLRRNQLEEAKTALNRAVDLHQQSQDILGEAYDLRTLGGLYLSQNQLEEADTALNRAVDLHRQSQDILGEAYDLRTLGELCIRRNRLEEADKALKGAVRLHQQANSVLGEADDLQILGGLHLHRRQFEESEAAINRAVDLHRQSQDIPGEAYDLRTLGVLYFLRNQLEEAEAAINRAIELHRQSQIVLGEAYDLRILGALYLRRNQLEDSEAALNCAVDLHRQSQSVFGEADDLRILGALYLRRYQLEDSEATLNYALDLHRRLHYVLGEAGDLQILGELYLHRNQLEEAEEALNRAVDLHQQLQYAPGEADDLRLLGTVYLRQDRLEEAELLLNRAVKLHQQSQYVPGEAEDLRTLGDLYLHRNQLEEAETAINSAVNLHQQLQDVRGEAYDLQTLGDLYLHRNQLEEAEEALKSAILLHKRTNDPLGHSGDLYLLTKLYLKLSKFQIAEDTCNRTIEISRKAHSARYEDLACLLLEDVQRHLVTSGESVASQKVQIDIGSC